MTNLLYETKALLPEHEVTGFDDRIEIGLRIDIDGTIYNGYMNFYYATDGNPERLTGEAIKKYVDKYLEVETAGLRGELDDYI